MSLLSANLKAFLAVSRIKTVHGASKIIGISQTGVTQRIRSLEKELGVSLFTRSRKGMNHTKEGEALFQYCLASESLEGKALSVINGAGIASEVELLITGPTSIMNARIIKQCLPLFKTWPKLNLNFIISDDENRVNMIREGKAQFALLRPHHVPLEMDSKLLKPEKFILVASKHWRGRKLREIIKNERIIDFSEEDPTTLNYLKHFKLINLVSRKRLYTDNNETLMQLFINGIGYGTLTREVAEPYLREGKLITLNKAQYLEDPIALSWYPRNEGPKYFKDIIKSIK